MIMLTYPPGRRLTVVRKDCLRIHLYPEPGLIVGDCCVTRVARVSARAGKMQFTLLLDADVVFLPPIPYRYGFQSRHHPYRPFSLEGSLRSCIVISGPEGSGCYLLSTCCRSLKAQISMVKITVLLLLPSHPLPRKYENRRLLP